jgi:glutamyl/glutaminyl-tRNA synthetase
MRPIHYEHPWNSLGPHSATTLSCGGGAGAGGAPGGAEVEQVEQEEEEEEEEEVSAAESCRQKHWVWGSGDGSSVAALRLAVAALEAADASTPLDEKQFFKLMQKAAKKGKVPPKRLLMGSRYVLTGIEVGAGMAETLGLLGREEVLARLQDFLSQNAPV